MRELILRNISNFESFENFQYPGLEYNSSGKLRGKVFIKWDEQEKKLFFVQLSKFERILRVFGYYSSFNRKNLSNYIVKQINSEFKDEHKFRKKASNQFKNYIDNSNASSRGPNEKESGSVKRELDSSKKEYVSVKTESCPKPNTEFNKDIHWLGFNTGIEDAIDPYGCAKGQSNIKLPVRIERELRAANYFFKFSPSSRSIVDEDIKYWESFVKQRKNYNQFKSLPFVLVILQYADKPNPFTAPNELFETFNKKNNVRVFFLPLNYSGLNDQYFHDNSNNLDQIKTLNIDISEHERKSYFSKDGTK